MRAEATTALHVTRTSICRCGATRYQAPATLYCSSTLEWREDRGLYCSGCGSLIFHLAIHGPWLFTLLDGRD